MIESQHRSRHALRPLVLVIHGQDTYKQAAEVGYGSERCPDGNPKMESEKSRIDTNLWKSISKEIMYFLENLQLHFTIKSSTYRICPTLFFFASSSAACRSVVELLLCDAS